MKTLVSISLCLALAACGGGSASNTANLGSGSSNSVVPGGEATPTGAQPPQQPDSPQQASQPQQPQQPAQSQQSQIFLLAGSPDEQGYVDGPGTQARFTRVQSLVNDGAGALYLVDSGTVRKISASGQVTTLAGNFNVYGHADGRGSEARFGMNARIAVDAEGNVYVADAPYIRRITPAGLVTTIAGAAESGTDDGPIATARFASKINGIAVDLFGNVFIDEGYYIQPPDRVRKISADGNVTTVHTCGAFPRGCGNIRVDAAGNLYVQSDYIAQSAGESRFSMSAELFKVTPDGTLANVSGFPSGSNRYLRLNVADIDSNGNVYFYEGDLTYQGPITYYTPIKSEYSLRKLTSSGSRVPIAPFSYVLPEDENAVPITTANGVKMPPLRQPPITVDTTGNIYFSGQSYIGRVGPSGQQAN